MSNPFEQIMSNPELFKVASTHHFHGNECLCGFVSPVSRQRTEHIMTETIAAALPEVTERGQLTALPEKIVLEDRRGTIWQKINGTWYTPGSKHDYSDQSVMLPARVLYRPEMKP